jgi:hypothetical protein
MTIGSCVLGDGRGFIKAACFIMDLKGLKHRLERAYASFGGLVRNLSRALRGRAQLATGIFPFTSAWHFDFL